MSAAPQLGRLGFVGLGNMGVHMGRNLAKAGAAPAVAFLDIRQEVSLTQNLTPSHTNAAPPPPGTCTSDSPRTNVKRP